LGHRATAIGGGAGRGERGAKKDEDRGGTGGGLPASKRKKNKSIKREELPIA